MSRDRDVPPVLDAASLARSLRETEAELARVTLRLHRLENATSVRLALLLAAAVRSPRKALAELRHAVALVRGRARRGRTAPAAAPAPRAARPPARTAAANDAAGDRLPERLLAASAALVTTRDRPVLAVVADAAAPGWGDGAYVQPLRPDDALAVFAAVTPDVLVVDARAGRDGPWSGLGGYDVPERGRTLLELLHAARDRGVPAVLVPPGTPGEAPMLADARQLFSGEVHPGATVADVVAAGQERA